MRGRELWFQGDAQPSNNDPTSRAIATCSVSMSYSARAKTERNRICTSTGECHNAVGPRGGFFDGAKRRRLAVPCTGNTRRPASQLPVALRRRSTSGTAMHGTAASTSDLPPHIIRCQSRAHRGYAVGRLAYRTNLVTGRQDGWLGLVPPLSPVLSLCRGDGVLKLTRRGSSVLLLYVSTPVNIFAVVSLLLRSNALVPR